MEIIIFVIVLIFIIIKNAAKIPVNEAQDEKTEDTPMKTLVQAGRQYVNRSQTYGPQANSSQRNRPQERVTNPVSGGGTQKASASPVSILERAKSNAAENRADVTLDTMEAEHKHSERVAPAVHHHPDDSLPENLLEDVSDLMVKGFDGNLCFERDFLGEGLDMISNFTAPDYNLLK